MPDTPIQRITEALEIITQYGGIDGAHHKAWVLDQVVRRLTGSSYDDFISEIRSGEDGPHTFGYDEGIAP